MSTFLQRRGAEKIRSMQEQTEGSLETTRVRESRGFQGARIFDFDLRRLSHHLSHRLVDANSSRAGAQVDRGVSSAAHFGFEIVLAEGSANDHGAGHFDASGAGVRPQIERRLLRHAQSNLAGPGTGFNV